MASTTVFGWHTLPTVQNLLYAICDDIITKLRPSQTTYKARSLLRMEHNERSLESGAGKMLGMLEYLFLRERTIIYESN